jgi:hypothetical protein
MELRNHDPAAFLQYEEHSVPTEWCDDGTVRTAKSDLSSERAA